MLRWISGNTRNIGFTWDGLVMFRGERLMRNSELIQVKGMKRGKRRQKITLIKVVKKWLVNKKHNKKYDFK